MASWTHLTPGDLMLMVIKHSAQFNGRLVDFATWFSEPHNDNTPLKPLPKIRDLNVFFVQTGSKDYDLAI